LEARIFSKADSRDWFFSTLTPRRQRMHGAGIQYSVGYEQLAADTYLVI
jgi:hypothetical protein